MTSGNSDTNRLFQFLDKVEHTGPDEYWGFYCRKKGQKP